MNTSIMNQAERGFTIIEVLATMVILTVFLTLLFQLYATSLSQRILVMRRAAANDIAQSNLRKITTKSQVAAISPSATCDNTTSGNGNANNGVLNTNIGTNAGSIIVTDPDGNTVTPEWGSGGSVSPRQSLTDTGLPASTTQTLLVAYPRGCTSLMPAKIISIVTYDSESVIRADYVN